MDRKENVEERKAEIANWNDKRMGERKKMEGTNENMERGRGEKGRKEKIII